MQYAERGLGSGSGFLCILSWLLCDHLSLPVQFDGLERLFAEMACYASSGMLNPTN